MCLIMWRNIAVVLNQKNFLKKEKKKKHISQEIKHKQQNNLKVIKENKVFFMSSTKYGQI